METPMTIFRPSWSDKEPHLNTKKVYTLPSPSPTKRNYPEGISLCKIWYTDYFKAWEWTPNRLLNPNPWEKGYGPYPLSVL